MDKQKTKPKPTKKPASIYEAIIKFQNEVPILTQNTKGYNYTYVDLAEIIRVITPILEKNNLGIIQPLESNGIRTILYHTESGDQIETFCEIPKDIQLKNMNFFQSYGSAISYFRRYSISSLLNLVSEKDSDARGEQKKSKRTLDDATFKKALVSIEAGNYSVSELKENFLLTDLQSRYIKNSYENKM